MTVIESATLTVTTGDPGGDSVIAVHVTSGQIPGYVTLTTDTGSTARVLIPVREPAPFPPGIVAVRLGTAQRALSGVDVARGAEQLVALTHGSGRAVTTTNEWGVESIVVAGRVIAVNDRQSAISTDPAGAAKGTPIPANGYVLSAHDQAGAWLRDNGPVGTTVTLVSDQPTPPPDPTPTGFPAHVAAMWLNSWDDPAGIGGWPADVKGLVNHVIIGMADSPRGQYGTGHLTYGGGGISAATVAEYKARGVCVAIGVGGSSNTGRILLRTPEHVDQMLADLQGMHADWGIWGVDYDLESPDDWTPDTMAALSRRLKAWMPEYRVGLTMGLYGRLGEQWLAAARAHAGAYDYATAMLYDFPEAGDRRLTDVAEQKIQAMIAGGVPAEKIVLGFMNRVDGETYENASPPGAASAAFAAAKSRHPDLMGFFEWESARAIRTRPAWGFLRDSGPLARK